MFALAANTKLGMLLAVQITMQEKKKKTGLVEVHEELCCERFAFDHFGPCRDVLHGRALCPAPVGQPSLSVDSPQVNQTQLSQHTEVAQRVRHLQIIIRELRSFGEYSPRNGYNSFWVLILCRRCLAALSVAGLSVYMSSGVISIYITQDVLNGYIPQLWPPPATNRTFQKMSGAACRASE